MRFRVDLDPRLLETEALGVPHPAGREQHLVRPDFLAVREHAVQPIVVAPDRRSATAEHEPHPHAGEDLREELRDLGVEEGEDALT